MRANDELGLFQQLLHLVDLARHGGTACSDGAEIGRGPAGVKPEAPKLLLQVILSYPEPLDRDRRPS